MQEIIVYAIKDGTETGKMGIAKSISEAKQICLNTPNIKKQGIKKLIYHPKSRWQIKKKKDLPETVSFIFYKPGTVVFLRQAEVMRITVIKIPYGYNVRPDFEDDIDAPGWNLTITKRKPDNKYIYTVEDYIKKFTNRNRGWF